MQNPVIKERPILFSTEMVRALLDGRKTQTRRIIKDFYREYNSYPWKKAKPRMIEGGSGIIMSDKTADGKQMIEPIKCPYGKKGDRLWVRETFAEITGGHGWWYKSENSHLLKVKWEPSIFMPRAASRITLEITNVRCEQLHDITDNDALAEGIWPLHYDTYHTLHKDLPFQDYREPKNSGQGLTPVYSYKTLWEKINGAESWEKNPYVWVIEFKVI